MQNMNKYIAYFTLTSFLIAGCATYKPQLKKDNSAGSVAQQPVHTFFMIGGYGEFEADEDGATIEILKQQLAVADTNSTLLFTGDNITPEPGDWEKDQALLDAQVALTHDFKGQTIFLPGNNEWKTYNASKIEKSEEHLDELDIEGVKFYPTNACPIEHKVINDELDLILIDSKWFISNWSRIEDINIKCTDIVTRRRFVEELEGYIGDGQGKNIVIAMHHPVFSNGKYAGQESLRSHLLPVPVVGTLLNGIMDLGAFSPDRLNSRRYNYLRILVTALAKESDRITIVSGHEESLQYLSGGDIRQVIAGSISKNTATRRSEDRITTIGGSLEYEGKFTYGERGFAKLEYFEDGSSRVTFYAADGQVFEMQNLEALPEPTYKPEYKEVTSKLMTEAVLDNKEPLDKSGFYRLLWGERYRPYFGTEVTAPVAMLDTLYGGLKVTKEGGGHQSYSIRLEDEDGKEYSMRSLRKNALKFLKFKIKGIAYTADEYEGTFAEELISDFFTTAHPYMQLVINPLARAIGVNHSSPTLFYIPKQEALGELNEQFGNELYFIEERPSDEQENFAGYRRAINEAGEVKEFESTTDMLEKIKGDESYSVNQREFIRARLFDMLIGDWDRHQDQWRWMEYEKEDGDKEFLPVPRDRDNTFPRFDGVAMPVIQLFVPPSRRWETYGPDIRDIKWFNAGGMALDKALLTEHDAAVWEEEARYIQENLSKEQIDAAFSRLPKEVQDETAREIRQNLERRLEKLTEFASRYSSQLDKMITLHGTEKDDKFEITRMPDGKTQVIMKRILSDEKDEVFFTRTFNGDRTKELWIYGLGDDDTFVVSGEGSQEIMIRLIGGYGEDIYEVTNSSELKVYDWKHEKIHFNEETPSKQLTDLYQTNTFHWRFYEVNSNLLVPNLGFRTDDGFFVGLRDTYTDNGFNGNPFRQKHSLSANYFFKFQAVEASYEGIFANIFPKWNYELDAYYASDRYSTNFFGLGNETVNSEDQLGRDYYRSRLQMIKLQTGIAYHTLRFRALYESFKLKEMPERFFTPANVDPETFELQHYVGGETSLYYENDDAEDFPTKALYFGLTAGYKLNPSISENQFGYLAFKAAFSHKLIDSGHLVLGSEAEVKTNFGDDYFFYHAPSLGGNNGLRGFRDERFAGKTYFYQSSDLRLRLLRFVTPLAPVTVGMYGGFDYGRVWEPGDDSGQWHTSQGGGLWISGFNFLAFNAGYFNSVEGNIIQVGFGFGF